MRPCRRQAKDTVSGLFDREEDWDEAGAVEGPDKAKGVEWPDDERGGVEGPDEGKVEDVDDTTCVELVRGEEGADGNSSETTSDGRGGSDGSSSEGRGGSDWSSSRGRTENSPKGSYKSSSSSNRGGIDSSSLDTNRG